MTWLKSQTQSARRQLRSRRAKRHIDRACADLSPELLLVDYFDTLVWRSVHRRDVAAISAARLASELELATSVADVLVARREAERAEGTKNEAAGFDREFDFLEVAARMHGELNLERTVACADFVELYLEIELSAELATQRLDQRVVDSVRRVATSCDVILVSDFYFPMPTFREMLEHHGLDGIFSSIVISCDHRLSKATGRLYDAVLDGLDGERDRSKILMIGDNPVSDQAMAASRALSTVLLSRPVQPRESNHHR